MAVYLGNYEVVLAVLREYAQEIMDTYDNIATEAMEPKEAAAHLRDEARKMAERFKGNDPDYQQAPWMETPVLAGKICAWVSTIDANKDPIYQFFERIAMHVMTLCKQIEMGMADEESANELTTFLTAIAQDLVGVRP